MKHEVVHLCRDVCLFFILFDESNFSDLVADVLQALLLKSSHEANVPLQLRHEEVFLDSEELALHAQANEGGHVRI